MIESTRHVVDKRVMEEQAHGRKAEQNLQAKMLIESTSTHVREQQRAQESHLRVLNEEFHREQARSQKP
eukprot:12904361-Prorocentrum_lima.AAC.1